jgi:ABC-type molybdate transport system substrate-binding protein
MSFHLVREFPISSELARTTRQNGSVTNMTNDSVHLNILISGGFSGAYEKLIPEFTRMNGIKVTTGSGASQGKGPQTIAAQLARGVATDVVILSREGPTELIAAKRIVAGTDADLARCQIGYAIWSLIGT